MALHWNVSKVKGSDTVCFTEADGKRTLNPATEALIFATMIIGLPEITEKDAKEFYWRILFYERTFGALRCKWVDDGSRSEGGVFFTPAEIRAHIGLSTNASRETRSAWVKRMGRSIDRLVNEKWKSAVAEGGVS